MVGRGTGLALGGAGQRQSARPVGQRVIGLDRVAHRIDVGVARAPVGIDLDAARLSDGKPGVGGKFGLGGHADRHDDGVCRDLDLSGGTRGPHKALLDRCHRGGDTQLDAVVVELLVQGLDHVVVERLENLVAALDHGDPLARAHEVLRNLDSHEAAADHAHATDVVAVHVRLERANVGHVAHREDVVGVGPRDGRHDWRGARGEDQLVVGLVVLATRCQVTHANGLGLAIDRDGLAPYANLDVVLPLELLGSHQYQAVAVGHDSTQVVRQRTVGEGDVLATLQHDDSGMRVQAPHARGGRRSTRDTTNDHKLHQFLPSRASLARSPVNSLPHVHQRQCQNDRRDRGGHDGRLLLKQFLDLRQALLGLAAPHEVGVQKHLARPSGGGNTK